MIREVLNLNRLRAMDPDDAAAVLAVRRSDDASAYDDDALAAWLMHDEANARAWERTQKAWLAFEDAEDDEILTALRRDARQVGPAVAVWRPRQAAAAAVIALLTGGLFLVLQNSDLLANHTKSGHAGPQVVASSSSPLTAVTYASPTGQPRVYGLPDGSRLTLDTDSIVESDFTPARRDLRLVKGRAFFDVKHDTQRPFVVRAAGREVEATGTRFDVKLDAESVRVVLVEGTVSVRPRHNSSSLMILHSGQQLMDSANQAAPIVSAANIAEALSWQQGFVTFDDASLAVAAAELNRYSREQIEIANPEIARLRVTGRFRAGDPMRFGRTLSEVYPVQMTRTAPDRLEITAR